MDLQQATPTGPRQVGDGPGDRTILSQGMIVNVQQRLLDRPANTLNGLGQVARQTLDFPVQRPVHPTSIIVLERGNGDVRQREAR